MENTKFDYKDGDPVGCKDTSAGYTQVSSHEQIANAAKQMWEPEQPESESNNGVVTPEA